MTQLPKLILLNGFAGAGKSTLGKRYIASHPSALLIEGDELIVNIGDWLYNEPKSRKIVYELTKSMMRTHLQQGCDVIAPYLITDNEHLVAFKQIAQETNAHFYNFYLYRPKQQAIDNLLQRGTWGEAGLDALSDKDQPNIEELYAKMDSQLGGQPSKIILSLENKTAKESITELMDYLK